MEAEILQVNINERNIARTKKLCKLPNAIYSVKVKGHRSSSRSSS